MSKFIFTATRASKQRKRDALSNMFALLGEDSFWSRQINKIVKNRCDGVITADTLGYKKNFRGKK